MTAGGGVDAFGYLLTAENAAAWHRAIASSQHGQLPAAVDTMSALLATQPDFVPAMVQLSHWLLAQDRYREARVLARRAASASPRSHELTLEIVRLLRRFEDPARIDELVRQVDWSRCGSALLLVRLAAELGPGGLYAQAQALVAMAAKIDPSLSELAQVQATLQMVSGEFGEARTALRQLADASSPRDAQMRWLLSMKPGPPDEARRDAELLAHRLAGPMANKDDEAHFAFALHNVLHALGRDEGSWAALQRGCSAKRAQVRYDRARQMELFDTLRDLPRMQCAPAPDPAEPNVIFVVGMHRSGTTLLERMLAGHGEVADGGESYTFSAALRHATDHHCNVVLDLELARRARVIDLDALGEDFGEYVRWKAAGRRWLTEKLPSNFLNLGWILAALPAARVLHMRRDPRDTCFSNLRTCFSNAAAYSYDQRELAEYFLRYRALMSHWHAMWPGRILDVDYEALVAEPEAQARRVMEFCGLEFQPAVLDVGRSRGHVATASLADARQGIQRDRGNVWQRYAAHLGPLLDGLASDADADVCR